MEGISKYEKHILSLYNKLNGRDKLKIEGIMELKIYEYNCMNNVIYISDYKKAKNSN